MRSDELARSHRSGSERGRRTEFTWDWRFALADPPNAHQPDYDDSGWRRLDLPLGTDNGRQEDRENFTSPVRRAYQGKVLAIVTAGARVTAKLGAAAPGVEWTGSSGSITFDPVRTTSVRLHLASAAPASAGGFPRIAELSPK